MRISLERRYAGQQASDRITVRFSRFLHTRLNTSLQVGCSSDGTQTWSKILINRMNLPIDIVTLVLVTAVISAALAITLFILADRSRSDGLPLWSLAMGLQAVAYGLLLTRGSISDWFSVVVANILLATTSALVLKALAQFFRQAISPWLIWSPVLAMTLGMLWLADHFQARVMLHAAIIGLQTFMMLILVMRHSPGAPGRGQYILMGALVAVLVLLSARFIGTAIGESAMDRLFESTLLQTATFLMAMLFHLLLVFGVIVMTRDQIDRELRASEQRFRTLVEDANDVIYTLDLDGAFEYLSPNLYESLGHVPEDFFGQHFSTLVHPDDLPRCEAFVQRLLSSRSKQRGLEYRVHDHQGGWRWQSTNASPLFDANGSLVGMIGIAHDISERKRIEEQTYRLAHYDALTDLPNRRLFFEHLHQAIREAERKHSQVAVMFLDLDRFKPINDHHGHAVGDRVLQLIAQRLRACLRDADTIGRIGGDEFLILLTDVGSAHDACVVANKLVHAAQTPLEVAELALQVSCSIGIALYPMHSRDITVLMRYADEALYAAKRAGRNQICLSNRADT